jgi:hypothetical protein
MTLWMSGCSGSPTWMQPRYALPRVIARIAGNAVVARAKQSGAGAPGYRTYRAAGGIAGGTHRINKRVEWAPHGPLRVPTEHARSKHLNRQWYVWQNTRLSYPERTG